ncbi:MAG: extracellular solute-binding protein [Clostridia bacterium]|nr:extracellular solute-binding protein [Clostridia bacterium]
MGSKKRNAVRAGAAALAAVLGLGGCGGGPDKKADNFTYWMELTGAASAIVSNYGDTPLAKELQKRTGITVEYQHPAQGQAAEKFNIMMSSTNLPDIVEYNWTKYPGGPGKAIQDGKIVRLNDYVDKYAPKLKAYLEENPDVAKLCMTDDGDIFAFPFIRSTKKLCISQGLVVRKDWLEELGIAEPETIDEWEAMLTAFKEKKNAEYPLDMNTWPFTVGAFSGAYGTPMAYYVENDTVKYGPYEPGFKDFLLKMNDWYEKGLITPDVSSVAGNIIDSDLMTGKAGAVFGALGGGLGKWLAAAPKDGFDLAGVKYPVLNKGDKPKFNASQLITPGTFTAITTSCKDPDAAAKFLSYGYSDEGAMLFNFGIEGESYTMEDGYPKYTDTITNNSEGFAMSNMLAQYVQSYMGGAFIQDERYMEQYASLPQQQDAWAKWSEDDGLVRTEPYLYYSNEKSTELVKKTTAVDTYVNEAVCKFIMGLEPMEKYDSFISELKNRGIDDVLSAKQEAYERYLNR